MGPSSTKVLCLISMMKKKRVKRRLVEPCFGLPNTDEWVHLFGRPFDLKIDHGFGISPLVQPDIRGALDKTGAVMAAIVLYYYHTEYHRFR